MWKILRINMSNLSATKEPFKDNYMGIGGRGLCAQVLADEVNPVCEPLGPENKVVLSTGVFAGMGLSCANRLSVGCKSPLTGGIKEANVGGTVATYMINHGIKAIVIEGKPQRDGFWMVRIDAVGKVSIEDAKEFIGMNNYRLIEALMSKYGDSIAVASIGCAGERMYKNSTVQITDNGTNYPCRAAARGGTGAVMGSKKIKALILEKAGKRYMPEYADKDKFIALRTELNKLLAEESASSPLRKVGTPDGVAHKQQVGALPVRNYSGERLENIKEISSARFMEIISKRGKNGLPCQTGCVIRCSNQINDERGNFLTGGFEYETVALCGANCMITDYDTIMRIDRMCDDFGIDTIETGATIAICMEAGKIPWGDGGAAMGLIQEMIDGTEFGTLLGGGAEVAGNYLGVSRIPVAKHQSMAGYDPRGAVITGVAYATSAMGADHTTAPSEGTCAELSPEEICNLSKNLQTMFAMCDNLFCGFAWIFWNKHLDKLASLYAAAYGGLAEPKRLLGLGSRTLKIEKKFNRDAGWKKTDDVIPDFFYTEKSEITGITFNVPQKILSRTMEFE